MRWHLLGIEGLAAQQLIELVDAAAGFSEILERDIKKVPALRGKTIVNLFLEPSTRTRTSFEIAGKILSADTVNISGTESSTSKGETLLDTATVIAAMRPDVLVVRHAQSGAPHMLARYLSDTSVVNAGDGLHEHPTQAILDLYTVRQALGRLTPLTIAIVGDVRHSRVARSNAHAHIALGNEVRLVGPRTLIPDELKEAFGGKVTLHHSLEEGLRGADVVMCLRMQLERMTDHFVPSLEEYSRWYGVSERKLAALAPTCVVMHPGPANRGVEISSEVLDGPRSLFHRQVTGGVAARMAILFNAVTKSDSKFSQSRGIAAL